MEFTNNLYPLLLSSSNLFYQVEKSTWVTAELISAKSLRFSIYKEPGREHRPLETFSMKELPFKIQDFEIFKGTPPVAVLNLGQKLVGMTISTVK